MPFPAHVNFPMVGWSDLSNTGGTYPTDGDTASPPHEDDQEYSLDSVYEYSQEPCMSDDEDCAFLSTLTLDYRPTSPVQKDVPPSLPSISDVEKYLTMTPDSEENDAIWAKILPMNAEDFIFPTEPLPRESRPLQEYVPDAPCKPPGARRSSRLEQQKTKRAREWGGGDKEVTCEVCARQFGSEGMLERHMRSHQEVKHKCTFCVKTFPQKVKTQAHVKAVHNKIKR